MSAAFSFKHISVFFVVITATVCAQNQQIDSLKAVLPTLTGKDRLAVLYTLSNKLENSLPGEATQYGLEGVALALHYGDSASLATLYSSLAYSASELGNFEQSLKYGYQSLDVSTRIRDNKKIASANSTLGIAYVYVGQYSKALQHHLEALRLREELGLVVPTANTLNNIGIVYHHIGQYDKAIEYYKRAIERHGSTLPDQAKVRQLTNIGYSEFKRGNIDIAMQYHNDALAIAEKSNFIGSLAYIYFNLGIMHSERNEHTAALGFLLRSLNNYETLGQKYGTVQLLNAIGTNYYKTGQYANALQYLHRAVELAKQIKAPGQLKTSYETLYDIYNKTGPLTTAHQYYLLYAAAKDSLMNVNESKKIAEIAIEHVTLQKQREIELLKNEKMIADLNLQQEEIRSTILYGGMMLLVAVSTLLFFNFRRVQKHKMLVEEANKELNAVNNELKEVNDELQMKMSEIKLLTGLLPICANCKKIRDDNGEWEKLEQYISNHSDAKFSHGICPDCMESLYGNVLRKYKE